MLPKGLFSSNNIPVQDFISVLQNLRADALVLLSLILGNLSHIWQSAISNVVSAAH